MRVLSSKTLPHVRKFKQCFKSSCTLTHLVGTSRVKERTRSKSRDDGANKRSNNQPNRGRLPSGSKGSHGGATNRGRSGSMSNNRSASKGGQHVPKRDKSISKSQGSPFSELKDFLVTMQRDVNSLRDQITLQNSRIDSLNPQETHFPALSANQKKQLWSQLLSGC